MTRDGSADVLRAAAALASRLPGPLAPFARIAFDYQWSWTPAGAELFRSIDPLRWERCGENPVRLLQEASTASLASAAQDEHLVGRATALANALEQEARPAGADRPVAFLCTEFAVHRSLPIYAGGLGVLAGDILKEASDRRLPMVGVGLLYWQGYFHQRLDLSGWQHEYWTDTDAERLPGALVTGADGLPLTVSVRMRGREVVLQVWRVDVGRVPLYLLDAQRPENSRLDRWITSRLYVGDRSVRLAQYAVLGIGGVRALRAMGIDPAAVHMNEGHVALAPLELVREATRAGRSFEEAVEEARGRTIFTTHTPVAAGNEAYTTEEILAVLGDFAEEVGADAKELLGLGREHPEDANEPFAMTALGLRLSRTANGVSARHGQVAREMWRHLFPEGAAGGVPIGHVTNGVHLPTWMAPPFRALLDRHLGAGWEARAADPRTWDAVDAIPDEEIWRARSRLRAELVAFVRDRVTGDRLARGEPPWYVVAGGGAFDPQVLTVGFARRVASYKRLYLLTLDPARALRLVEVDHGIQLVLAGKPHPVDDDAKRILQGIFGFKWAPHVADRVAFLENYDLAIASKLVAGCDLWINVPRPPLEASGTSGMKAALNGGLNLSVLDGWWEEAYDGSNGWGIASHAVADHHAQDAADAAALYTLVESEVIPLFYDRDAGGVPRGWVRRIKASLRTIGPRFCATRMMDEYAALYRAG